MEKPTTFSAPFLCSSLPSDTKILHLRIYFRVKTTDIDNKYEIYYRAYADGSSMLEGFYFTVLHTPVSVIFSFCIIIAIASAEGLIFFLDISNTFQNTILQNAEERHYIILPNL